jgi:Tol biopolymer transport system component
VRAVLKVHLWHVSYPAGNARQITEGIDREVGVSVSADSLQIVTVQENVFSSIWRMPLEHSPELVASGKSGSSAPIWTPDGRIVFEEELDGRRSIWIVSEDGAHRRQLTHEGNSYDHSVSADGSKLAFVSDRSGIPAIWVTDLEGQNAVMVSKATGEPVPALSPNGNWVAFTAIGSQHWTTLWRVNSSGGQPVELSDKLWLRPVISPDGKWVSGFYEDHARGTQTIPSSVAVIPSNGGRASKIIPIPQSVSLSAGLRWSRDSRHLTFVDKRSDGDNIFSLSLNGGPPHQMTHLKGAEIFSFDWSPDGKQLVLSRGMLSRDVVLVEDTGRK